MVAESGIGAGVDSSWGARLVTAPHDASNKSLHRTLDPVLALLSQRCGPRASAGELRRYTRVPLVAALR